MPILYMFGALYSLKNLPMRKTLNGIDWLVVSEYLRTARGVHGTVAACTENARQGALAFHALGYSADTFVDVRDGSYRLGRTTARWACSTICASAAARDALGRGSSTSPACSSCSCRSPGWDCCSI